jgi:hypothetical protein
VRYAISAVKNLSNRKERKDRKERTTPKTLPLNSNALLPPNDKVSHRSQPPMTYDLSLGQPAGSGWLDRLVRRSFVDTTASTWQKTEHPRPMVALAAHSPR